MIYLSFIYEEESFYQQIGLKFEEEASEMLRLEHGSVWCWNLDAPSNRSETPGKFWNVVLEKDGEDQLDRSCETYTDIPLLIDLESMSRGISYMK